MLRLNWLSSTLFSTRMEMKSKILGMNKSRNQPSMKHYSSCRKRWETWSRVLSNMATSRISDGTRPSTQLPNSCSPLRRTRKPKSSFQPPILVRSCKTLRMSMRKLRRRLGKLTTIYTSVLRRCNIWQKLRQLRWP